MNFDYNYWENRYREGATGWDTGGITTPLKTYIDQLNRKDLRLLVPGAGNAYEARYLHQQGFRRVFVNDWALEPLRTIKYHCPDFPGKHLLQEDFFDLQPAYDLILEQTFFCALPPAMRPAYARKCHELLAPGGRLVGVLFNDKLNTRQPPFGGSAEEYRFYFHPYFEFKKFATCYNSIPPRSGRELFINLVKK